MSPPRASPWQLQLRAGLCQAVDLQLPKPLKRRPCRPPIASPVSTPCPTQDNGMVEFFNGWIKDVPQCHYCCLGEEHSSTLHRYVFVRVRHCRRSPSKERRLCRRRRTGPVRGMCRDLGAGGCIAPRVGTGSCRDLPSLPRCQILAPVDIANRTAAGSGDYSQQVPVVQAGRPRGCW